MAERTEEIVAAELGRAAIELDDRMMAHKQQQEKVNRLATELRNLQKTNG